MIQSAKAHSKTGNPHVYWASHDHPLGCLDSHHDPLDNHPMITFAGIDPGATGGLGLVDQDGRYLFATRWSKANPASLFQELHQYQPHRTLIEVVAIFPRSGMGHAVMGQSLLVNAGIWRGFLIALGLSWGEVHPSTWLAGYKLSQWKKRVKEDEERLKIYGYVTAPHHSPLTLARALWPDAPLQYQADDGKAVGLLLADLARREVMAVQDGHSNDYASAYGPEFPKPIPKARVAKKPKAHI